MTIRYVAGIRDEVIYQTAFSILPEMTSETAAGRMCVETASLTLAAGLIHKYCDCGSSTLTTLDAHPLDHVRLRRVLDYISTNIDDDITTPDLARVAALIYKHVPFCSHVHP
jgi:AraC family transcriptional regulator